MAVVIESPRADACAEPSLPDAHGDVDDYNDGTIMANHPPLVARVKNGRLVLDVPTDLPEGAEIELHVPEARDDFGPELTDEERAEIRADIERSMDEFDAGLGIDGDIVMAELRARLSQP